MIKDNLNNAYKYYELSPLIQQGLKFLENTDLTNIKPDKYILDDDIYVNVEEYTTRTSDNIEAHKKYIDIQYIIKGEENIGVTSLSNLTQITDYNNEKDIAFYKGKVNFNLMKKNDFLILYPDDAHLPCQTNLTPTKVKKAVVKIKITNY